MSQTNPSHSRTSSVASVLIFTRGFFKTQLWVWPLIAALATGMALGIAPPALTSAINAMVKRRTPERNAVTYLMNAGRR